MPMREPWQAWCLLSILLTATSAAAEESSLRYLPSDTRLVLTIHADVLGGQERKLGDEFIRRLYFGKLAPELSGSEELPISDVREVVIASPYAGTLSGVTLLRGKINRTLFDKQLRGAAKASKSLSVEMLGKPATAVFRRTLDESLWTDLFPQLSLVPPRLRKLVVPTEVFVAAVDDETLFICMAGKTQMVRALRARPAGTSPRISDELTKLLRKQNPKDVAAFALLDDSLNPAIQLVVDEKVKESFEQFDNITARIRGGKEVTILIEITGKSSELAGGLTTKSEETLRHLRENIDKLVPNKQRRTVLDALLKGLRVTRKDNRVTLAGTLSEEDVRKLLTAGR